MFRKSIVIVFMLGLCLAVKEAAAFEMLENFFNKLDLGYEEGAIIGMGVGVVSKPYIDVDAQVIPAPMINLQYKRFFIEGSSIGYYLNKNEKFKFAAIGAPRFWGYEPDDSNALTNMTKRGGSFDAGVRGTLVNDALFDTEVTFLSDVTDEHNGQEVALFIKRAFVQGALTPRIGLKWHSNNLVEHYFGVKTSEARPGRPAYDPDSSMSFVAGGTLALPIGEKWAFVTDASVMVMGEEMTDSPIVEDDAIWSVVSGFVYRY